MMKRTVPRMGPDDAPPPSTASPAQIQQAGASNMHTLAQTAQPQILGTTSMVPLGASFARARAAGPPPVVNYLKAGAVQYAAKPAPAPPRMKVNHQPPTPLAPLPLAVGRQSPGAAALPPSPAAQFQRLKVEDALSYLDQVKYKFNTQPQVYNDFLDIMKEFKSQTIDTPGVITRVSNLFKGHPQLIVGFNTFLPPGYKIEVQSNGQVSVSMPSPSGAGGVLVGVPHAPPQLVHLLPAPPSVSSAIVHNLSVSASPANTLHHISQAHQQIEAAIHHQQAKGSGPAPPHAPHTPPAPPGQPVEFNHAIEYVNKIKSRFSRQPEKYKRFLEILHAYQRGHRDLKEPQAKQQTEQEVYSQVAKLFENQDDLLTEFGQFLPDAKAVTKPQHFPHVRSPPPLQTHQSEPDRLGPAPSASPPPHALHHANISKHAGPVSAAPTPHLKRSPSFTSSTQMAAGAPAAKKCRLSTSALTGAAVRDVSYAEAAKRATLHDYSFFDRVRKALRSRHVYDNFLRCLLLYTNEIISGTELVSVAAPFLCRHPELQRWLQDLVAPPNKQGAYNNTPFAPTAPLFERDRERDRERERDNAPPVRLPLVRHDRSAPDQAMDIDLTTCKRLGTSYCALPREAAGRRCGGRTPLCKEVLNDTWVSIPAWSEDSTFVTSRKTQYEEFIYRCEDERFELDVVIETNAATIRVLEGVQKKLSRMSPEDAARHRLDDCLGGQSPTVQQRALRRIYGDKAVDIIAGLKKNPLVAVPVVLRRLKAKEEEWREAQKGFNKQWREQNEKYYLKSLDHQGINFKQNDLKAMRSKALFNELETAAATRRPPPHLVVDYTLNTRQEAIKVLRDASELLIHHARRQTAIQKAEKRRIKRLLRRFLPALFSHPPLPPSDDEEEPASPDSTADVVKDEQSSSVKQEKDSSESDNNSDKGSRNNKDKENKPKNINTDESSNSANSVKRSSSNEEVLLKTEIKMEDDDDYRDNSSNEGRFVCSMSWYLFLRVHGALCQRLAHVRRAANALANVSANAAANTPASRLRLARHNLPADVNSPADYYNALLELVKGVLDGNMESSMLEDCAREMFGIKAYPAYTLDKLVSIAVRQLQHIVSEPWSLRCAELYSRRGTRPRHAAAALARHHHQPTLATVYGGDECKVTFELLDIGSEGGNSPNNDNSRLSPTNQSRPSTTNGDTVSLVQAWSLYTEQFSRPGGLSRAAPPVFLRRNARARGGDGTNAAPRAAAACEPRRRKPPRPRDSLECTTFNKIRMVVNRPHQLYRAGALAAARASHARLHAARRRRLRAWTSRASDL